MTIRRSSRGIVGAIATQVFAVAWCAISGVAAVAAVGSHAWLVVLFALPFVIVGALLAVLALRETLAVFLPRVAVEFSSESVAADGELTITWKVSRGLRWPSMLTLAFEGYEWTQYTRGTDTTTDERVFSSHVVHEAFGREELRAGVVRYVIPRRSVPTFRAANNAIRWRVRFRGVVTNYPDLDACFDIEVTPPAPLARSVYRTAASEARA